MFADEHRSPLGVFKREKAACFLVKNSAIPNISFPEVTKGLTRHQIYQFIAQINYNQRS
jgi:hypothetical protein